MRADSGNTGDAMYFTLPATNSQKRKGLFSGTVGLAACFMIFNGGTMEKLGGAALESKRDEAAPVIQEVRTSRFDKLILSLDIAANSDEAALAFEDLTIRVFGITNGRIEHEFSFRSPETDESLRLDDDVEPIRLRFSGDGKALAASFISQVFVFEVGSWKQLAVLGVPSEDQHRPDLKITPRSPKLKNRSAGEAAQQKSEPLPSINDVMRSWATARARGDGRTRITDFAFTKDNKRILVSYCKGGCYSGPRRHIEVFPTGQDPVRLWDIASQKLIWERTYGSRGTIVSLTLSPGGLAFAGVDAALGQCTARVYSIEDGSLSSSLPSGPLCNPPQFVGFVADGQSILSNRLPVENHKDKRLRHLAFFDVNTGNVTSDFSQHDTVRLAALSPDKRWLVSAPWTLSGIRIWNLALREAISIPAIKKLEFTKRPIDHIAFSSDGRWLVIGNDEMGDLSFCRFVSSPGNQ